MAPRHAAASRCRHKACGLHHSTLGCFLCSQSDFSGSNEQTQTCSTMGMQQFDQDSYRHTTTRFEEECVLQLLTEFGSKQGRLASHLTGNVMPAVCSRAAACKLARAKQALAPCSMHRWVDITSSCKSGLSATCPRPLGPFEGSADRALGRSLHKHSPAARPPNSSRQTLPRVHAGC